MRLKSYFLCVFLLCLPAVLVSNLAIAQTTIKVSNPQGRSLPLLMLNSTSGANVTGLTGSAVGTAVAVAQSVSNGSTASGATSLILSSATGFPTSGSVWVPTQNAFVTYTGISTNTLTGIPASGAGSITTTVPTATLVTTGKAGSISVQWTYNLTTSNVYPAQGFPALGAGSIIETTNGQYEYIPTAYETALAADLHYIFSASNVSDYNAMLVVQTYKVDDIGAKTSLLPTWPAYFASLAIDSNGRLVLQPSQPGVTIPTVTTLTTAPSPGYYYAPVLDAGSSAGTSLVVTVTNPGNSSTSRTITWTADSSATSYKVMRSTDGLNYTRIATVAPPTVTYVDNARPAGNVYYSVISVH